MSQKICSACRKPHDIDKFLLIKDKSGNRVPCSYCHECRRDIGRKSYERHKDEILARRRARYEQNPKAHYRIAENWRKRNLAKVAALTKRWRERHPEYDARESDRLRRLADPAKARIKNKIQNNRRRVRVRAAGPHLASQEWLEILAAYNETCLRCLRTGDVVKISIDHVVPISKGGVGSKHNIQPLCRSCNSSKRDKVIDYRLGAELMTYWASDYVGV